MGRPKNSEDTKTLTTRLTTSQREAFDEYVRREQAKMPRGAALAEAAVLRGMVLRCLDQEGIPYIGAQQTLFGSPRAPVEEPPPPPPPPVEEPPPPPPTVTAKPVKSITKAKKGAATKTKPTVTAPAKKTKTPPPRATSTKAKKPKKR